jgi:hypothetical protein
VDDKERLLKRASRRTVINAVKRARDDRYARAYLESLFQDCGLMSGKECPTQEAGETFSLSAPPSVGTSRAESFGYSRYQYRRSLDGQDAERHEQVIVSDDDAVFCIEALLRPVAGERGIVVKAAPKGDVVGAQWSSSRSVVLIGDGLLAFTAVWLEATSVEAEVRDACNRGRWIAIRRTACGRIALSLLGEEGSQYRVTADSRKQFEVGALCIDFIKQGYKAVQEVDVRSLLKDYVSSKDGQTDSSVRVEVTGRADE